MWESLGKLVAGAAPLLGGSLLGPAGATIGSMIAAEFGVDNEPDKILAAINQDPDSRLKLVKLQQDHKVQLKQMAVNLALAEMQDTQSARKEHKHSHMPAVLCCYLTVCVSLYAVALLTMDIPKDNNRLLDTLFGAFLTCWLASCAYWNGSTRSSAEKDRR